ncbi:MAG: response regulator receiver [Ferruginibacter sp.]|nr:response regulator receiver [Ferruginibacter sp.]
MKHKLNCILLIDDDEPTNFISNMLLEDAGCSNHIQIEESGKGALDYLEQTALTGRNGNVLPFPELIFLDINMPAMNGWEFLEKYSQSILPQQHPEVIIIMLTTSINPDDKLRADCIPLVAGFANKPLTDTLIQAIMNKYFVTHQV